MGAVGAHALVRWLVAGLAAAFLGSGAYGTWSYVHDYDVYRGFPPAVDPRGVSTGRLTKVPFYSPSLHERRYYVLYLPPGYAQAAARGVRFPVLYLLHAPPGRPENYFKAGALNVRMDVLLARHRIRSFLVVAPYGRSGAYGSDTEWANARAGRFESYVLDTVHAVDGRWSTIPDRRGRMIAGLSEGAYAAANVALRNIGTFGSFESWSGYYLQSATGVFKGVPRPELLANSPAVYAQRVAPAIRRLGLDAFVYQGDRDDVSIPAMLAFASELRSAGAHVHAAVYPGRHNWALWRAHLTRMLTFASGAFHGAPGGGATGAVARTEWARSGHDRRDALAVGTGYAGAS